MTTTPGTATSSSLPAVARTLIDLFRELHPETDACIVQSGESTRAIIYPPAGTTPESGANDEHFHLALADNSALRLRVRRGAVAPDIVARLVDSLAATLGYEREARSSAQELSDRYEEINLLYSISEILGSIPAFADAATRILAEVMDVVSARRASLWVHWPETNALELVAAVGEDGLRGPIPVDDRESATAWVFREKQAMNVERPPMAEAAPGRPRPRSPEAFLSVPINFTPPDGQTRTVGVLTLVGRRSGSRFALGDERLLAAIASQIGAAIEAQRLIQETLSQERVLRELELAHDLQLKLLPEPETFEPPPEIAARCVPAQTIGGDFYQLYRLSGDRLGLLIGDVSGHGFSAALIMALTMSAIGIYAKEEETPAEVLRRVHRALIKELESTEMYLSLFYGVLDLTDGRLDYANAGHPQAYRLDTEGRVTRLGSTGPPLGAMPLEPYGERVALWQKGDTLVLFTDGLSDSLADRLGSGSGETRLVQEISDRRGEPLDTIVRDIFENSDAHPSSEPDDRTLLLVR